MYLPGEGIGYHKDNPLLGDPVSIFGSQSDTTIFLKTPPTGTRFASASLPALSLSSRGPHATSGTTGLVFGMRKNILEKSETRQNNRSFHMKREQKIAHFMKNSQFFEKMRNWHPNQSHCDASGPTVSSLKHSLCF